MRYSGFHRPPDPGQIDVDQRLPLVVGYLPEPSPVADARVGHHHVETVAELCDPRGQRGVQRLLIPDVGDPADDPGTFGFDQRDRLGQIRLGRGGVGVRRGRRARDVDRDDRRALPRQPHRVTAPLAAGGAGDERDPAIQQSAPRGAHAPSTAASASRLRSHASCFWK